MFHNIIKIIGLVLTFSFFLFGCSKPGYLVRIETNKIDFSVVNKLKHIVKEKDFSTTTEERKTFKDDFISTYWKDLPDGKYYFISISFIYSKPLFPNSPVALTVDIENAVKGGDPTIMVLIDEIGDRIYKELVREVGKEQVAITRKSIMPNIWW